MGSSTPWDEFGIKVKRWFETSDVCGGEWR